ncbi:MAG: hypothetical protein JNJ58_08270 [Chitinophagaceae bacterium]|nr:hypothetical protein [Chitinophagaceae bacterium]
MKYCFLLLASTLFGLHATAQKDQKKDPWTSTEIWTPVPINRQLWHDKIDKLQKTADDFDHKQDGRVDVNGRRLDTDYFTDAILRKTDQYQSVIENLPLDHYGKIKNLQLLETNLKAFVYDLQNGKPEAKYYTDLMESFFVILKKQYNNENLVDFINGNFSRAIYGNMHMFKEDRVAVSTVYLNMVQRYPEEMQSRFNEYADMEAAELMMAYLATKQPNLILTYATSTARERYIVRRCKDPLVKTIVNIADKATTPLRAIVYVEDLKNNAMSMAEVNAATQDNASYYRSLIQQRLKQQSLTKKILDRESKQMALEYVRTMNELHDAQDPVRFKCVEPLTASEMYFLMVLCSDEIYTSTFVGTFNRMLAKMAPVKGDQFLTDLNMDKFRTFIRMCAGYNKLDEYLKTIDEPNRNTLMATFVHDIDKNKDTDIEDAVDVADAFGSIDDPVLLEYLLNEVKKDYERTYTDNNKRGLIIYFLLHTLCTSIINPEETSDDLQAQLKIPPISFVPYKNLTDTGGKVIQQIFFYGDEDGKSSFNSFLSNYKATDWKIEKNENWMKLTSILGSPVELYANLPLDEPKDEEAQKLLVKYLEDQKIHPSIIIHRGHSYHLPTTLKYLKPENKIIILGSCGGYHNLSTILGYSEDAHIISSKQTGTMLVTDPILKSVNTRLLAGKDINWIDLWTEVGGLMKTPALIDKFNDYVPPHKNMGALFLKAFKIQMAENTL